MCENGDSQNYSKSRSQESKAVVRLSQRRFWYPHRIGPILDKSNGKKATIQPKFQAVRPLGCVKSQVARGEGKLTELE